MTLRSDVFVKSGSGPYGLGSSEAVGALCKAPALARIGDNLPVRLYHDHPYQNQFTAKVVRSWTEGSKHFAVLSQTLFYPSAGGQPHDTGTLGNVRVTEVYEESKASGDVVHVLTGPLIAGDEVEGQIDWARRYRLMQRHTAQHILSQAFLRAGGWETVAVNLTSPVCTIDFSSEPQEEVARQAEALAAWAVYAASPIKQFWVDQGELHNFPLRRPPKVSGKIRLVEIEGWDLAACGGTHLKNSAEAGPIKLLKHERYKGGTRVYFVAGWEALEDYSQKHLVLAKLAEKFSAPALEIEKPIANQAGEIFRLKGENMALRDELAERIMRELLALSPGLTIAAEVPGVVLEAVGKRLSEWPGVLAFLVSPGEDKARLVLTKHPGRSEQLDALWKEILEPLGARGGGKDIKLGVLPAGAIHAALEEFRKQLPRSIRPTP